MAQRNSADGLPPGVIEENECRAEAPGDHDPSLKSDDEISHARDKDLIIPTAIVQSTAAENSAHLGQILEPLDDGTSSNMRSTSHSNENLASEDQELSQLGNVILDKIRKKLLFKLGAGTDSVPGLELFSLRLSEFSIVDRSEKGNLVWSPRSGTLPDKVADAIRRGWPQKRDVKGLTRILLQSDGTMPVTYVSRQSDGKDLHQQYHSLAQLTFHQETGDALFFAYERLWHKWCLAAAESQQREQVESKLLSIFLEKH